MVSVIIPIYNVEKYLNKCLESLENQSYSDIEVLMVDDGSKDNSAAICDEFAKKDSRFKAFHRENAGVSAARNYGIEMAAGEYLAFVDGDDYVSADYVEVLLKTLEENNVKMACCNYFEDIDGVLSDKGLFPQGVYNPEDILKNVLVSVTIGNFPFNKIFRRDLFENVRFPVGRKMMEDLGIFYLLLEKCEKIAVTEQRLYYYVKRGGSANKANTRGHLLDKYELSVERYFYLKEEYPDLVENDAFMAKSMLEVYPYLADDNGIRDIIEGIIGQIEFGEISEFLDKKTKAKYAMYKLNKKLFVKAVRIKK